MALAGIPLVALGLGRFGHGLLLPAMEHAHGWSYADSGVLAGANSVGYLLGARHAPGVIHRRGAAATMVLGTWLAAITIALTAIDAGFAWTAVMRLGTGYFGGVAFVAGGVIATRLRALGSSHALAIYPAGAGAGIALSVVSLDGLLRDHRWQASWLVLGGIAAAAALVIGRSATPTAAPSPIPTTTYRRCRLPGAVRSAYTLYGLGYIIVATFALAFLEDRGVPADVRARFWLVVGLSAVVAPGVWRHVLNRLPGGLPLAAPMLVVAASSLTLLASQASVVVLLAAILFGAGFLAAISGMTSIVHRDLPAASWSQALAVLTTWFAVGQSAGPVLAGLVGDSRTGLAAALAGSAVVLIAGAVLATTADRRIPANEDP